MNRKKILTGGVACALLIGLLAIPASAHGGRHHSGAGYLPQQGFIPGWLTLDRVLRDYDMTRGDLLKWFPLFEKLFGTKIYAMSGGERRILECYLILRSPTRFILLDEPFSQVAPLHVSALKRLILHDCGKGVGFLAGNGGKIHDYEGVDKSKKPFPPYVAVNTTAGTASEMTRFCIITDTSRKVKMAIVDWRCTPSVAIDDPVLMMGMPPALTAATGMDALTHAVEAYVSTAATPMTDACAEKAMEYINRYLRRAVANGRDKEAREGMCYAQYLAGMAFNNASLGHVHAMAHQLGGFYDLPHGECNAILLPHVCEYNRISSRRRFGRIAQLLGELTQGISADEASRKAITAINILSKDVGIPDGLIALGKKYGKEVREADIPTMTANAQKDACGLTNPRSMTDAAVAAIYKAAL